jgi:hypothetical protein
MSDEREIPTRKERKKRSAAKNGSPKQLKGPQLQKKMSDNQEKRRQALVLRRQGATYDQIGKALEVSTMTAHRYVNDAIAAIPREEAKEVKALAISKLDAQEMRLNVLLESTTRKPTVLELVRIELALVRIAERRARLEGHDAPTRAEITGKDGAPLALSVADLEGMTDEQLERYIANASRGGGARGRHSDPEEARGGASGEARRSH